MLISIGFFLGAFREHLLTILVVPILSIVAIRSIAGKIEVVIGNISYVFIGVGKIGIKKHFDWNSVSRIYQEKYEGNLERSTIFIETTDKRKNIEFGTELEDENRYFLFKMLQYFNDNKTNYVA